MTRTFAIFALLAGIPAIAPATPLVDFTVLSGPLNITNNGGQNPSVTTLGGVTFSYDPGIDPQSQPFGPALCSFDEGQGMSFGGPGGCVGAQVDSGGVFGTTEGNYLLQFIVPTDHFFADMLFVTAVSGEGEIHPTGFYDVGAIFMLDGEIIPNGILDTPFDGVALGGGQDENGNDLPPQFVIGSGQLDFTSPGGAFDSVSLFISPFAATQPFGTTTVQMDQVSSPVPEPGSGLPLGVALLGIGYLLRKAKTRVRRDA